MDRNRGQISILIAVMMTTFILLFAFVVNTGMLIHAKINLQNAADLAAYAGAAVQARQMTHISYLNYEMRRQWKKFLFKIYVIGNAALPGFGQGRGPMTYVVKDPSTGAALDYHIPVTCIIFDSKDNFCQVLSLKAIQIPGESYLDAITNTLREQLQQIENIREANCNMIGLTNKLLNYYWLFNADPQLTQLTADSSQLMGDQLKALQIIQGLASEIGIIPRELILSYRIQTLAGYLNTLTPGALTVESVQQLQQGVDPAAFERSIQAFYSAYYTLGNHLFHGSSIVLEEFLPTPQVAKIETITQEFDTYALDLKRDSAGNCNASIVPFVIRPGIPVGVYKDPTHLVSYAVRLKATAQILFSPFGDVELKAYAAAQPFGSRIGPIIEKNGFGSRANSHPDTSVMADVIGFNPSFMIPNLPTQISDSSPPSQGTGWDTHEVLSTAYQFLNLANPSSTITISQNSVRGAYPSVMSANPWELGKYNIMNDLAVADPFIQNFDANGNAILWAPIFPPGSSSQEITDQIKTFVSALFSSSADAQTAALGSGTDPMGQIQTTFLQGLDYYISSALRQGSGDGEGWNTVTITNPFPKASSGQQKNGSSAYFVGMQPNPKDIQTSFNPTLDDDSSASLGRTGYSVKVVSFDSLSRHKMTTDGQTLWNNDPSWDDEANADIPFIKH